MTKGWCGTTVVVTERFVFFWKPPAVFCQWTRSHFTIDDVEYTYAEQFMMAAKARLFGDAEILEKIMASEDPKTQKRLGQQVRGFDGATWDAQRLEIVSAGNLAKLEQSEKARGELLATGERTLVEASPLDRIWGIGLAADHPDAESPLGGAGRTCSARH